MQTLSDIKLSFSNIAWDIEEDLKMYSILSSNGFQGLEIAPTRVFNDPYEDLKQSKAYAQNLKQKYNLEISSIQSIWYGKTESLFSSREERATLLDSTKKCILFAESMNCKNIVFGCPKNRIINKAEDIDFARDFFCELGSFATQHHTILSLEPNAADYGTNFLTTTEETLAFIKQINNDGIRLNYDLGTSILNEEDLICIEHNIEYINHVHISEPFLDRIQKRDLHRKLIEILERGNYNKYVSIEMSKYKQKEDIINSLNMIRELLK